MKKLGADLNRDGAIDTDEYFDLVYKMVSTSEEINGVVVLGLDAVYSPKTGVRDDVKTDLWVSNKFLSKKVKELNNRLMSETDPQKRQKRFFGGASVSPNRNDWKDEMDFVLSDPNMVLIKLIPSAQHIIISSPKHTEYYEYLAANGMPLLCHVGPELSFPEGMREKKLDNFKYLEKPLECGVTVIAAHCATPVFASVFSNDEVREFYAFMKRANPNPNKVRLYGDTSAFTLSTRLPIVDEILRTFPPEWLIHGSDFPIPIDGWAHLPWITSDITVEEYVQIQKTQNLLDKEVRIKRAHGFSDSILENAEKVLRLPQP
jgi:predicted TIM-barrel fold metal-dependent hydrolase